MESTNEKIEDANVNCSPERQCDMEEVFQNNTLVVDDKEVMKMQFTTKTEAENFYKEYAKHMGFKVRKSHKTHKEGTITIFHWVCNRAGTRIPLPKGKKRRRKETPNLRCNCEAKFRISLQSSTGLYTVLLFDSKHNHDLKTRENQDNSSLSESDKSLLTLMRNAGIRPCQSMNYVEQTSGVTGQSQRRKKNMYNYLNKERVETMRNGDINIAMSLLEGMKINDPDMMFDSTVDKEGKLTRLFWCDGFARSAFQSFGDVLICDSTYKTNTYRFPLVILSGIDNHFKCTVFGAALLQNETIESYEWLFNKFVETMGGKTPNVVVTDQDEAMRVATRLAFPNAIHRLCGWHLQTNCMKHVKVSGFCNVFGKLMTKRCSVEEFERRWLMETEKHGVTNNTWVKSTYARKEMWSDAYLRGQFVGMTRTSQRAESLNFVFKQHGKAGYTITELLKHFHNVLGKMRDTYRDMQRKFEESPANFPRNAPLYPLYNSLSTVYTKAIMDKVEKEIVKEQSFIVAENFEGDTGGTTFLLTKFGFDSSKKWYVHVNITKGIFQCECEMLAADGLLCRHLFTAFKNMNIQEIPPECICRRWTIEAGRELASNSQNQNNSTDPTSLLFMQLNKECSSLCMKASQSDTATAKSIEKAVQQLARGIRTNEGPTTRSRKFFENEKISGKKNNIGDPKRIPTRGAPPRQAQRCSKCGEPGNKSGTCQNNPLGVKKGVSVKSRGKKGIKIQPNDRSLADEDLHHPDTASEEI